MFQRDYMLNMTLALLLKRQQSILELFLHIDSWDWEIYHRFMWLGEWVFCPSLSLSPWQVTCRDGESNNLSWNCGAEGPTADLGIQRLRARQQRNLAAALLLAQGVPMIVMGDEYGHSKVSCCRCSAFCSSCLPLVMGWLSFPNVIEPARPSPTIGT